MNELQAYMRQCLALAESALPEDVPVGAMMLEGTTVISRACNRRERDHNPVAHAEMLVLQEAATKRNDWRLNGITLIVTLEPCPMCASAIIQARVGRVVFGAYDPVMGACGSRYNLFADAPQVEVIGGVLEEPCGKLLRDFFRRA